MIDDLVTRLRRYGEWLREDRDPSLFNLVTDEAADRIEALEKAIQKQARAVRQLQKSEETEINKLRKTHQQSFIAAQTLDSERNANAILTDRIEALEAALRKIADGTRDADKSYAELFVEVCIEARAALGEKKDGN